MYNLYYATKVSKTGIKKTIVPGKLSTQTDTILNCKAESVTGDDGTREMDVW